MIYRLCLDANVKQRTPCQAPSTSQAVSISIENLRDRIVTFPYAEAISSQQQLPTLNNYGREDIAVVQPTVEGIKKSFWRRLPPVSHQIAQKVRNNVVYPPT